MLSRGRILKMENGEDLAYKNVQVTLVVEYDLILTEFISPRNILEPI